MRYEVYAKITLLEPQLLSTCITAVQDATCMHTHQKSQGNNQLECQGHNSTSMDIKKYAHVSRVYDRFDLGRTPGKDSWEGFLQNRNPHRCAIEGGVKDPMGRHDVR